MNVNFPISSFSSKSFSSFEYENNNNNSGSADDIINTISSIDFPIYRSIQVENSNQFLESSNNSYSFNYSNEVLSQPMLKRPSLNKSTPIINQFEIEITQNGDESNLFLDSSDDDLMSFLNDTLGESEIPSLSQLDFDCLAKTSILLNDLQIDEVITKITEYLEENKISSTKKGESKWICESFHQSEFIKFHIQIFSTSNGFMIEFLRLSGCSLGFSFLFRQFNNKSKVVIQQQQQPSKVENESEINDISTETILSLLQCNLNEGIKIICSSLFLTNNIENMLQTITKTLLERQELTSIIIFTRYLLNQINSSSSSTSSLILQCYDNLIPLLVKESFNLTTSLLIRSQCKELIERRVTLY